MKNDFIERILIPEIFVQEYYFDGKGDIHVVGEIKIDKAVCPTCGNITKKVVKYYPRKVRHLPIVRRACYIHFEMREFQCERCGKCFNQTLDFVGSYKHYTKDYERYIKRLLKNNTVYWVAEFENIKYHVVRRIFEEGISKDVEPELKDITHIGIDEISNKKGHKNFMVIISDIKKGKVLDVLEDRKKETIKKWLIGLGEEELMKLKVVCIDMWQAFAQAVGEVAPWVEVVIDRFHVMRNLNKAINKIRREIQNKASDETKGSLKGSRWIILKNEAKLNEEERKKLKEIYEAAPYLKKSHQLKEEFRRIYEKKISKVEAAREMNDWISKVKRSGVKYLVKFTDTLMNWWEGILGYFKEGITNGLSEGINNKIKTIKRMAYGFSNFKNFRTRILYDTS